MPRFFIAREQISDELVRVTGDDAHHIARSLRMAVGEHVTLCDDSREYDCELISFDDDKCVTARILSSQPLSCEPPYHVTLYQALP